MADSVKQLNNGFAKEEGKINLVSTDYTMSIDKEIQADTFISNWTLTESSREFDSHRRG